MIRSESTLLVSEKFRVPRKFDKSCYHKFVVFLKRRRMSSFTELEIIVPDDFHHHLRDGDVLKEIVHHAARSFGRILAMPNIKPPVRNLEEV